MIQKTITIDIALLLLVLSSMAQWVNIYLVGKRLKQEREMKSQEVKAPICAAAADMVANHIAMLATHAAELESMKQSLDLLRSSQEAGMASVNKKLDTIQTILMGGSVEKE